MRRLKSNPTTREDIKIRKANLKKNTQLFRRDLFLDNKGLLRVGGRIIRADAAYVPHQTPSHDTEKGSYYVTSHSILPSTNQSSRPWNPLQRNLRRRTVHHW